MPMLRNKTKIITTRTVIFLPPYKFPFGRVLPRSVIEYTEMPHFQTANTRQFDGDNSFFKLLIERKTLPEYDGVSFI
jgi:hypothetical protein